MNTITSSLSSSHSQQTKLFGTTQQQFIYRINACTEALKQFYNSKDSSKKEFSAQLVPMNSSSVLPSLIEQLPMECVAHILHYTPPGSASVCKLWQTCHKTCWEKLQGDYPTENFSALLKERRQYQMSCDEMINGGLQNLNLMFIGKELVKEHPRTCLDKDYTRLTFKAEGFQNLTLQKQAEVVRSFFQVFQSKIESLHLRHIGLTTIPEEIYKLSNLKYLELSGNKIVAIHEDQFEGLKKLPMYTLNLEENPLKKYPATLFFALCNENIRGIYQAQPSIGHTLGGYNKFDRIGNSWQNVLADRCYWKYFQYINNTYNTMGFFKGLQEQFLKPHKALFQEIQDSLDQEGRVSIPIQDLIEMTDWEDMNSLAQQIKPINDLYFDVLPNVATCLVAIEILALLYNHVQKPLIESLEHSLIQFIDTFKLLQDRFVDLEVMNDLMREYEAIIAIIKNEDCFPKELPNREVILKQRQNWIQNQEQYLIDFKSIIEKISALDSKELSFAFLFMDAVKADYPIMNNSMNSLALAIKEMDPKKSPFNIHSSPLSQ